MKHLDLFSGIGGFALAAQWAGFETIAFSEVDKYCCKVLKKHWPDVPNLGDITKYEQWPELEDLIMGAPRKNFSSAVEMYESGLSIEYVARQYGVSRQSLWMVLKRRGVAMRSNVKTHADNHFYRGGPLSSGYVHNVTEKAIEKGRLTPMSCEICGDFGYFEDGRRRVQAHHDDYNKPLDVRWLCQKHHHEWHKNNKPIGRKEVMPNGATRKGRSTDNELLITGGFP